MEFTELAVVLCATICRTADPHTHRSGNAVIGIEIERTRHAFCQTYFTF